MRRGLLRLGLVGLLGLFGLGVAATAGWWGRAADLRLPAAAAQSAPDAAAVTRGAYLAQVGHCAGCHTAQGGPAYGGGRSLNTPFGAVVTANLTPDAEHGLGRWGPEAFRRALKDGRSADGRALLPACPYTNFSLIDEADADDLFAFLRSLPPQPLPVPAHRLDGPYGLPVALVAWRLRHHRVATLPPAPAGAGADWARGAYLVGGLAHCSACHGQRDGWGATDGAWDLRGGEIPMQGWLAPSLLDPAEAGLAGWSTEEVVALLTTGRNRHATVSGPMAVVVAHSTQHLSEADARAMATFLRQLPAPRKVASPPAAAAPPADLLQAGQQLYADHCADCHGKAGEGVADSGPALQGNRALALVSPVNVIRMVLGGGFGPSTAAEPMPPGMPPYATVLSDEQIAAVVTHLRWQYGERASAVTAFEVNRQRGGAVR